MSTAPTARSALRSARSWPRSKGRSAPGSSTSPSEGRGLCGLLGSATVGPDVRRRLPRPRPRPSRSSQDRPGRHVQLARVSERSIDGASRYREAFSVVRGRKAMRTVDTQPDRAATLAPPRGFRDILPTEARELRAIERTLSESFASYGYLPLDPPLLERGDAAGLADPDRLIAFLDRDGTRVALRPDLTTAVARLVAQRYAAADGALRLSYFAPVFREEPAMLGAEREFDQAGVELVGPVGPLADAEVLALLAASLVGAGLHDQTIEVGHAGIMRAVFGGLAEEARAGVLRELREGDRVGAMRAAQRSGMSAAALAKAERVLAARGMRDLDALDAPGVDELREILRLARELFGGDWIVPNLALLPALPYYTGIVFEALRPEAGFRIAAGGRYDGLLAAYGAARPAVGFAINVPRLHRALFESGWRPSCPPPLVVLEPGDPLATARCAARLRGAGLVVATGPGPETANPPGMARAAVDEGHLRHANRRTPPLDEV